MSTVSGCVPQNGSNEDLGFWGWDGWFVLVLIVLMFVALFFDVARVHFVLVASVTILMAAQIITVPQGLAGFSNSGVLTVAILYPVAEGLAATGAIDYYMVKIMGTPKTTTQALVRMMVPVAITSAFINNTPLVAVMIPIVRKWCKLINIPPSQLMIPLSFATILGGTATLIGTSTNLVVAGQALKYYCRQISIFEITPVGLPFAFQAMTFLLIFVPVFLPGAAEYRRRMGNLKASGAPKRTRPLTEQEREEQAMERSGSILDRLRLSVIRTGRRCRACCAAFVPMDAEERQRLEEIALKEGADDDLVEAWRKLPTIDFMFHAVVPANALGVINHTVKDAGLRGDSGSGQYLCSVQRGTLLLPAVPSSFVIRESDVLSFTGEAEKFVEFCAAKGLQPITVEDEDAVPDVSKTHSAYDKQAQEVESDPITLKNAPSTMTSYTVHAVVSSGSELVGRTPKEVNFRSLYNAAIIAIHRAGTPLNEPRLGRVTLRVGDVLVLVTSPNFSWDSPETNRDLKQQAASGSNGVPQYETNTYIDRQFLIPMVVAEQPLLKFTRKYDGLTVNDAGLRSLPDAFLIAVERDGEMNRAVGSDFVLRVGDITWFVADRAGLGTVRSLPGLDVVDRDQIGKVNVHPIDRQLVEIVVAPTSDLIGKTVRESKFRTRFGAAIVAVHRTENPQFGRIGDIVLHKGDVLVVDTDTRFATRFRDDPNFLLVSGIHESAPPRFDKVFIALPLALAMIILAAAIPTLNLVYLASLVAMLYLATGILSGDRANRSVSWDVIVTVACADGLSTALAKTRIATVFGNAIVDLAELTNTGELGAYVTVMFATTILSALIANNAAAQLMFPIAARAADLLRLDPIMMLVALMLGASDFTTPMGYQTNLMVQEPGGYVFADYIRLGLPFSLWNLIFQTVSIAALPYWYINAIVSVGGFFLVGFFLDKYRAWRERRLTRRRENAVAGNERDRKSVVDAV